MKIEDYDKQFYPLKPEVMWAGGYLEDRGLRFGDDFGPSDAIRKATDLILMVFDEEEHYGHAV